MKNSMAVCLAVCGIALAPIAAQSPIRPGDRIAIVGNTFADQLRIHGYLETQLLERWPNDPVSIRNLGWGGDMLTARDRPTGFPSEETSLREHQTDVIIACFGMSESFAGDAGLNNFKSDLEAFLNTHSGKCYNGETAVRLILVSPIAYEDLAELTPSFERRNQELKSYSMAMGEVAAAAQLPFVDLYQPSRYLMDESTGPNFTTNGIHLNPYGYWAISHVLFRELVKDNSTASLQPWRLAIDAASETISASGVVVSALVVDGSGLVFQVKEVSAPSLPPPTETDIPPQLSFQRDTLIVTDLRPGSYSLTVDGQPVVAATHEVWSAGVAIDSSPAHKEAAAVRQAVNDKNMQFTYGWKALNQVHIVGERKSSPSGRALPAEVIEFKQLAELREQELPRLMQRKTRQWRLERKP